MVSTETPALAPSPGNHNMGAYETLRKSFSWLEAEDHFGWSRDTKVNMAYEAVDRHVAAGFGHKIALHYLDDTRKDQGSEVKWSFAQLKEESDKYAALLHSHGLVEGDRVFIFLPKIPELYAALLGTIKAGAIAGPLFEAFYRDALLDRMGDCEARFLIVSPDLLERVPLADLPHLEKVFVLGAGTIPSNTPRCTIYKLEDELTKLGTDFPSPLRLVDRNAGMIIHYTSGSTGKPKGILHAHRAMIQQWQTAHWVLDLKEEDVYWCTAHPGWVTGSSYGVFAPWLARARVLVNGGRFDADSWYSLIDRAQVSVWYSAPTAFRMLMSAGSHTRARYSLTSLRHLISVGEPLNPELVHWGIREFKVRIHDTWWMTETGAQLVANLPQEPIKPGSMGRALPGISVAILDKDGKELPRGSVGQLAVKTPWPSLMKEVWKRPQKFAEYFAVPGYYISGDSAYMDEDGYVFFQGRDDDLIVASGEKVSPFEVESTLVSHKAVAEAGVIGKPDELRGSLVKAFIVLREGYEASPDLIRDIKSYVKTKLSAHAQVREIEVLETLPKTRVSGKIMRRILKAWETGSPVGDTTTLEGSERKTLFREEV